MPEQLFAAQRDYANSRYDFIINSLRLKEVAGTLSPEDIARLKAFITLHTASRQRVTIYDADQRAACLIRMGITPKAPADSVRLPDNEGRQLYEWAARSLGPLIEISSYCGRSTIWLAQAALRHNTVVYAVDHHRGSEEHQPGESHHDPALVDGSGAVDTFHEFRRNITEAGVDSAVIPIVAASAQLARFCGGLAMVFIDGGHSLEAR